jgi:hypothetical protein
VPRWVLGRVGEAVFGRLDGEVVLFAVAKGGSPRVEPVCTHVRVAGTLGPDGRKPVSFAKAVHLFGGGGAELTVLTALGDNHY